MIKYYNIIRRY